MHELLLKIRAELQARLSGHRDGDIFITPDLGFIPQGVKMPCVGIKDGKVTHAYMAGDTKDLTMTVHLVLYQDLKKQTEALVGNEATSRLGILQVTKEVLGILEGNDLGIAGMEREVRVVSDPESRLYLTADKEMYQRKELALQYTKSEETS